jgi:hypothetical protein
LSAASGYFSKGPVRSATARLGTGARKRRYRPNPTSTMAAAATAIHHGTPRQREGMEAFSRLGSGTPLLFELIWGKATTFPPEPAASASAESHWKRSTSVYSS